MCFEKKMQPKISVLDGSVNELPDTEGGGVCKWVQLKIGCATDEPLLSCEVFLKSIVRITSDVPSKELVEEPVHCNWSQRAERTIQINPGLPAKVNLFSFIKGTQLKLEIDPPKLTLKRAIQTPRTYKGTVAIVADRVRPQEKSFEFCWSDYDHLSLDLVG
jgi:hypothetical protein